MISASEQGDEIPQAVVTRIARRRILVIEDEANAREGLCLLLADEGFDVREAADGEEGLRQIVEFNPEAVLCDLELPKLGGLRLMHSSRQLGASAGFIMMTGSGRTGVEEALRTGADTYLLKPLDLGAVLLAVELVLGRQTH